MTQGIKVSKPTKDITSTEPRDFVLHSEYNTAVIYKEDQVDVTIPATSSVLTTVNFGVTFDFIPVVMIFVELTSGSGRWYTSPFTFGTSDPEETFIETFGAEVTTSSFSFYLSNKTGSQKIVSYRYYIFMNLV